MTSRLDKTDRNPGRGAAGASAKPGSGAVEDSFAGDFAKVKLNVIRPAFDALADWLKARGNGVEISEEPDGNISMRIVPPGAGRLPGSDGRFPTFSVHGSSFTRTVGLQSRNTKPGAEAASGSRGTYTLAQINTPFLEAELMKFVDAIAGW